MIDCVSQAKSPRHQGRFQ